jgi:excinuclease ABC subunit C
LRLLQQARDEAHRFAITFQRHKRAARTITSELLSIPGVGPTRRRALLHRFGSVQGVRDAALDDIAAIPGFGLTLARAVHSALGVPLPPEPVSPDDIALADTTPSDSATSDTTPSDLTPDAASSNDAPPVDPFPSDSISS